MDNGVLERYAGQFEYVFFILAEVYEMPGRTKEDIIRMVREENVEFIRLQFTDIFGMLKNVAITSGQLEKAP